MKHWLLYSLSAILLFCTVSETKASYFVKHKATNQLKVAYNTGGTYIKVAFPEIESVQTTSANSSDYTSLPRGRGNGKSSMKAFIFGFLSIFPILGLIFVPFAFINGIKNRGRIRKGHAFAIAGMILALFGIALTIAILTV